jgi:uncharacterized membrane protein
MQRPSYSPLRLADFSKHSFQILCLVVIVLGIFFRFSSLDKKVFWHDETYTAIAVSGYERDDVRRDLILSLGLSTEELQGYQTIDPDTTWEDTLESVAEEEPQNSPLYFLLSRFWVQLTQLPVASGMRLLSAVISLLTFPAAFWLCWELFQSVQVAWLGTALIGSSPIHLLYAQEARQYSLLTVATLATSALLLRVTQQKNPYLALLSWSIYAILCTLGLYTQPFFLFVMFGHGVYILFRKPFRFKTILSYSLASILSVIVYAPWLYVILTDLEAISGWRGDTELSFSGLIGRWLLNLSRIFADFYAGDLQNYDLIFSLTNPFLYLVLALLLLVGYSFYYLVRYTPRNVWLFIVTLSVFPTLFLAIADLVEGGVRSTIPRYILPSFLGVQLAVLALFAAKLFGKTTWTYQQYVCRGAIALLLTLSCLSCLQISQASVWWNKYSNYYDKEVLALLNADPAPVVVGHGTIRLSSLSTGLRNDALLQLTDGKTITRLPVPEREHIFVYDLEFYTRSIVQTIRRQYGFDAELLYSQPLGFIHTDLQVWRVIPVRHESLIQSFRDLEED